MTTINRNRKKSSANINFLPYEKAKKWVSKIVILKLKTSKGASRKFKVKKIYTKNGIDSIPFDKNETVEHSKYIKLEGIGCKIRIDENESVSEHCQYIYGGLIPETPDGKINKRNHYYWFPEENIFTEFSGDPEESFIGVQKNVDGVVYRSPHSKKIYIPKKSPIYNNDFQFCILEANAVKKMLLP